jgi:hypothetical protein
MNHPLGTHRAHVHERVTRALMGRLDAIHKTAYCRVYNFVRLRVYGCMSKYVDSTPRRYRCFLWPSSSPLGQPRHLVESSPRRMVPCVCFLAHPPTGPSGTKNTTTAWRMLLSRQDCVELQRAEKPSYRSVTLPSSSPLHRRSVLRLTFLQVPRVADRERDRRSPRSRSPPAHPVLPRRGATLPRRRAAR